MARHEMGRPNVNARYEASVGKQHVRFQTGTAGDFDELVIKHWKSEETGSLVVHVEAMDTRQWFCDVAGLKLWVWVDDDGVARITGSEDNRPCAARVFAREKRGLCQGNRIELRDPELDKPKRSRRK